MSQRKFFSDESAQRYAAEQRYEFKETSTGIKIGSRHEPRPSRELGAEAERIQRVLLAPTRTWYERLLDFIDSGWPAWFGMAAAAGAAYALLVRHGLT